MCECPSLQYTESILTKFTRNIYSSQHICILYGHDMLFLKVLKSTCMLRNKALQIMFQAFYKNRLQCFLFMLTKLYQVSCTIRYTYLNPQNFPLKMCFFFQQMGSLTNSLLQSFQIQRLNTDLRLAKLSQNMFWGQNIYTGYFENVESRLLF